MEEQIEQLIDDFTRETVQTAASWGEDTPTDFAPRADFIKEILMRFIKGYIEIIFKF